VLCLVGVGSVQRLSQCGWPVGPALGPAPGDMSKIKSGFRVCTPHLTLHFPMPLPCTPMHTYVSAVHVYSTWPSQSM
jgi:hypothetical protein